MSSQTLLLHNCSLSIIPFMLILFQNEAIEMQDVRMSPILSLRSRNNFNFECEGGMAPSFRMAPSVSRASYPIRGGHTQLIRRKNANNLQKRKRVLTSLKKKAKELRQKMPTVKDVNKIDKYSRLVFPLLFIVFNACYWCFYLLQWLSFLEKLSEISLTCREVVVQYRFGHVSLGLFEWRAKWKTIQDGCRLQKMEIVCSVQDRLTRRRVGSSVMDSQVTKKWWKLDSTKQGTSTR